MRQDDGFSLKVTEASFIKGVSGSTIRLMSKILGLYVDILNPQTKKIIIIKMRIKQNQSVSTAWK